jgi:2-keto-3-deoxygluconate permease
MELKKHLEQIPGGMMIVPLVIGSVIATVAPRAGTFFGSFTGALFTGALPILAVFYVCMGATISFKALPEVASKGGVLLTAKVVAGICVGILVGHYLGEKPVTSGSLVFLRWPSWPPSMTPTAVFIWL